jgi:uncharacterized membrane protein YjjB (DUF3815 family)
VIKRYNNLSFLFFIPGVIMQIAGLVMTKPAESADPELLPLLLLLGGTALAFVGFAYYAMAKGRSALWGFCGFLGLIGLIVLALLKDRSGDPWNT